MEPGRGLQGRDRGEDARASWAAGVKKVLKGDYLHVGTPR